MSPIRTDSYSDEAIIILAALAREASSEQFVKASRAASHAIREMNRFFEDELEDSVRVIAIAAMGLYFAGQADLFTEFCEDALSADEEEDSFERLIEDAIAYGEEYSPEFYRNSRADIAERESLIRRAKRLAKEE